MSINGLGQYDLFSSYNSINAIDRIPKAAVETAGQEKSTDTALMAPEKAPGFVPLKRQDNASLENISLSLQSNSEFDMKGRDSSLSTLDMEKAVSDMQKDQALMQYQYFVGDSNIMNSSQDGIVIQKVPQ